MKRLIGVLLVFFLIPFIFSGPGDAFKNIEALLSGAGSALLFLIQMALKFPSELGLTDAVHTWIFYLFLTFAFGFLGETLSRKGEKKLFAIVSWIVSAMSLFLTVAAVYN